MYDITPETLKWAYKKLKCYYYNYKGSNYVKEKIIEFDKKLDENEAVFDDMAISLNRQVDSCNWVKLSSYCDYVVYPKKNAFAQDSGRIAVNKYNTFIDLPLDYYLVDVLFCLNIIESLNYEIKGYAFAPASNFKRTADLLHNKYIFDYYWDGYKKWMNIPSNSYLKDSNSSRLVVKMDLKECFYNVDFNFKKLINDLNIKNNVSLIMGSIYRCYSSKVLGDKYAKEKRTDFSILPVGLISSSVVLNYLLFDFDKEIENIDDVISYGRYVDDIYVVIKADKSLTYDEIVKRYFAGKIFHEEDSYSIKASGRLSNNLPINGAKISIRFLDENNHPDINWKDFEIASFIEDFEIPEFDDETIKIDDSDIKYTRSIIRNYNPQDYKKIRKAFFNLTDCDLLNSYSLWMDIFRIIKENKDEDTCIALKNRIKNSLEAVKCFTRETYDAVMTDRLTKQLMYELEFSTKYCNCDSSEVAYLFNIKGSDVYNLLRNAIECDEDRLPFNASIVDLSLYYSHCSKRLDSELQSFVIEKYIKLNGLENIDDFKVSACTLYEEDKLLRVKINELNPGKVKICIACIPMHYFDGFDAEEQYTVHFGNLSKLSFFDIDKIIEEASNSKCDYIIFPEFAMSLDNIWQTVRRCRQKHISLITGIDHFIEGEYAYNLCCVFDRDTNLVFLKPKNYLPLKEKIIIQKSGHKSFEPGKKKYLIIEDGNLSYSTMMCYEATNILDRAILAGNINCLFMPVYNKDTKYFSNIVESFSRDVSAYVVQANCNGYGDSRVRVPSKDFSADVIRTKGGENVHCIVCELDVGNIKQRNEEYLNSLHNTVEYEYGDIKPLSAGSVHYEIDKEREKTYEEKVSSIY